MDARDIAHDANKLSELAGPYPQFADNVKNAPTGRPASVPVSA